MASLLPLPSTCPCPAPKTVDLGGPHECSRGLQQQSNGAPQGACLGLELGPLSACSPGRGPGINTPPEAPREEGLKTLCEQMGTGTSDSCPHPRGDTRGQETQAGVLYSAIKAPVLRMPQLLSSPQWRPEYFLLPLAQDRSPLPSCRSTHTGFVL